MKQAFLFVLLSLLVLSSTRTFVVTPVHDNSDPVNYYVNNGSRVFCGFLDASKAFDRVVHAGLFLKPIQRKIPLIFLDLVITWYSCLFCRVKWGDSYSEWFLVTAGVRQGGILSPYLFNVYMDDLSLRLKKHYAGCTIANNIINHLF